MLIAKYGKGNEKRIKKFEDKYGVALDSEYRTFLINYNGGETPETTFKSGKRQESLRYLYGINTKESIEVQLEYFDYQERACIPIGTDVFGNYFAIGISEENRGLIYFCDHERGFRKSKIANSFKDFISKCTSEQIKPPLPPKQIEKKIIEEGRKNIINKHLRKYWKEQYKHYKNMVQEEVVL